MSLTPAQDSAVKTRGNVLVVAGAGTGKTKTLVERCLALVLDQNSPANIDEILLVTFTEAAAAEMRNRIRVQLESRPDVCERQRCLDQLDRLDSAHIGTIHSFCFKLVRQHFYELDLDPQVSILREEEAALLKTETLARLLRRLYADSTDLAVRTRALIRAHGAGSDELIRQTILKLHGYTQTLADPATWMREQRAMLEQPDPKHWREWLTSHLPVWRDEWMSFLEGMPPENQVAQSCHEVLAGISETVAYPQISSILEQLKDAFANCAKGKKTEWVKPLKKFEDDIAFLTSLTRQDGGADPLTQDWEWTRGSLLTLLEVTAEFTKLFSAEKKELAGLDFHDLEQLALHILWDRSAGKPSAIAAEWQERLKYIFVDEYQDINNAQDRIIQSLSRSGTAANRFLVGDAKQSIYRFRLASPGIFRNYMRTWHGTEGMTIALKENFRSREALLNFTNKLFRHIMPLELGGIDYKSQALEFGAPAKRTHFAANSQPATELHLRLLSEESEEAPDSEEASIENPLEELLEAEKEAYLIGCRLLELRDSKSPVYDESIQSFRPTGWKDMAILLRAPSRKAESYAKAFDRLGIPLQVAKRGFYDSVEILDLLSLLQVLDNPLQDVPLIAVLHSPFGNFTIPQIAEIRLAARKVHFWNALIAAQNSSSNPSLAKGCAAFLANIARWRRLARHASLSACLEIILAETCYREWLLTQTRGAQREANIQRFVSLAREFDQFQRRGLLRFLACVEAQMESAHEPEVAAGADSDAVRLMSIHQSKGLEFPIVALPDLSKPFNTSDLRANIFLSERYGVCSHVRPPNTRGKYPSLPLWLARREEQRELLGEELRLLYVAVTRARDRLILSATVSQKKFDSWCSPRSGVPLSALRNARCYADWLGVWCQEHLQLGAAQSGETPDVSWFVHGPEMNPVERAESPAQADSSLGGEQLVPAVVQKLRWHYAYPDSITEPAKTSASMLRRRVEGPTPWLPRQAGFSEDDMSILTGAERGCAHHLFLQHVALDNPGQITTLRAESSRLLLRKILSPDQERSLDYEGIAAFWNSESGKAVLEHRANVHRELAFTARFHYRELASLAGLPPKPELDQEFVVLQGVADLAVILPDQVWIIDFKTDTVDEKQALKRRQDYAAQMRVYSAALSRIYNRPVTRSELFFLNARLAVPV